MRIAGFKNVCFIVLIVMAFGTAEAYGQDRKGNLVPIKIHSARLESFNDQRKIVFTGNVVAKRAEMTIWADQMIVIYRKDDKKTSPKDSGKEQVETITAKGHVKMTKGNRTATGAEGVYHDAEQIVVLTGNPQVWQNENTVKGDKITVYLAEDRSLVECNEGNKVEAVVYSEGDKDN